ncbi:hypothetical protein MMC24_001736 [Lignoscripta atroalba]|nr:hypothetical protein [Lignoscripta atroalba]
MAFIQCALRSARGHWRPGLQLRRCYLCAPSYSRKESTNVSGSSDIAAILAKPSWSVQSLLDTSDKSVTDSTITKKQLNHLLRLCALPLPETKEEETKMIQTLESQLHFVRAIQRVDTSGIEPLQSIRDETMEAEQEHEITVGSLQAYFDKEEVVGSSGRIRNKKVHAVDTRVVEDWNALAQASKKVGRYIVVDTSKS